MKKLKTFLKISLPIIGIFIVICLTIFIFPQILFAHQAEYKQFIVYSDRPLNKDIEPVLDEAIKRLSKSDLYDSEQKFRVFVCNDIWRLMIFSRGNDNVGGLAFADLTQDIFLRPVDFKKNKIIPPDSWKFAKNPWTFDDRPLSYYIAHESTHVLQYRHTRRFLWRYPTWLIEGYADYIGKGNDFDFEENLRLFKKNAPELDPKKGLYRRYHLMVAYLLEFKKMDIKDVFANPPNEEKILEELKNLNS